jgi:choline transport protein
MSEETHDAGMATLKSMIWSFVIKLLYGFGFLITMLFVITDVDGALNDPSGNSFIWILKQTLPHSTANISAITAILIILSLASNISFTGWTSR